MSWDEDLSKMMQLCFCIIEVNNGRTIAAGDGWKNDAQIIGIKLFRHIASAQQVSSGISFDYGPDRNFTIVDHSSVAVIVRAAIEAYLAFDYIFTNKDANLSIYRHKLWQRAGLIERGKMLANTLESKQILESEAATIEKLYAEIQSNDFYLNSNSETRKEINNGGWKPKGGWYTITSHTDIHQKYFSDVYSHLSGHSHANYISALQIRDAWSISDQHMLASSARQILCLIIAHFMFSYVRLFPNVKSVFESDEKLWAIANGWFIQKADVTDIYGKVGS